jgi:hypothetical protein
LETQYGCHPDRSANGNLVPPGIYGAPVGMTSFKDQDLLFEFPFLSALIRVNPRSGFLFFYQGPSSAINAFRLQ